MNNPLNMISLMGKTAFRTLKTNPGYTLINILGLTLGMASFFLIMLFVRGELSYDRYHENADRIYRLALRAVIGDTRINQTTTSSRMFREMTERFPEIEKGVKLLSLPNLSVRSGANTLVEPVVIFADSTLFDIFSWPLVQGSPETALNKPNTLVINESTAIKYFGQTNPVGQNLTLDLLDQGIRSFEVTGVFREIPEHSHLHASMFASLISFPEYLAEQEWSANNFITYFLLKPGTDPEELTRKFTGYTIETIGPDKYEAFRARGDSWDFFLQPLTSIHLKSDLSGELEANGNSAYVYIFTFIAFFVLIIAGINFMNLATAKATLRAREVGIRKISGSSRSQLIRQFLGESVILTFLSVVLSLIVVWLVLPAFSAWLGKPVTFHLPASIRPFALIHQRTSTPSFFSIRHLPDQSEQVLREIQQVWNRMFPGTEFRYTYPEQHFSTIYRNEIQTRQVFLMLMILAVIVALLGLLGLTVFITRKRIREIAIRKISGASIPVILALITRKFMIWTAISIILASAAGWWVMERWLEGFTYRIPLGASIFILSGMLALVVVLTMVSLITFRIALLNPAQTLKYE